MSQYRFNLINIFFFENVSKVEDIIPPEDESIVVKDEPLIPGALKKILKTEN